MVVAFLTGAGVFAFGVLIGSALTQASFNKVLNYDDNKKDI